MMRLLASFLFTLMLALPAAAQTGGPVMGSSATDAPAEQTEADTRQVLVIGDVLGGGLGAGMTRLTEASGEAEITSRFVEESGIARPEVYDWAATLPKIFDSGSYDAVVVLLGTNDRQMIKDGNFRHAFGAPEWAAAYAKQTDRLLEVLAKSGAAVFWVSLPPMADKEFEAAMQQVMSIQKDRVAARGFSFVDIRKAFLTGSGAYTDTGPDDTGEVRKLRSSDGITFFKQGNNRLAQLVLAAVRAGAAPVPVAAPEEQISVHTTPPEIATMELPVFGQWDADGKPRMVTPKDVLVAMASASSATYSIRASGIEDLIRSITPGSASEALFKRGEVGKPPAGRLDDYSVPPPAE
jgi:uncharacterized protein